MAPLASRTPLCLHWGRASSASRWAACRVRRIRQRYPLLPEPHQWRTGSTKDLGVLGRAAMLVGGCCGAYVGFRGSWLWVVLFLIGGALYVILSSAKWVVWGGF